ncbi:cytochrome P450 [Aspergillus pseudoustus]|uniref:Cytochrome P450 n=1 Tax=Aspergillus pseudoustus TaxID=1810923 RepID=A0ABR4KEK6_9EURO
MPIPVSGVKTVLTAQTIRIAYFGPLRNIPGPWYARLTGLRLSWSVFANNRIHYVHALHRGFGPIVRIGPQEIDVADPVAGREIHRMGSGFTKAPFYALLSPGPVDNIFNFRDAKLHVARRKLYARGFTLQSLRSEWEPRVREITELTVQRIKRDALKGEAEIMGWWTLMANEVVCQLTFGGGAGTVAKGVKEPFVLMLERRMGDLAHLLKHFAPPAYYVGRMLAWVVPRLQDVFYSQERMFDAGGVVVSKARDVKVNSDGTRNLFNKALEEGTLTDTDIITDAGALLLAGSDPTAISLTFLLWCVLSRPEVQKQVEAEVATLPDKITDVACEQLPIFNAVIDESLRLYGAAPGCMPRSPPPGGASVGGYFVPGDTVVVTQNWSLQRNPGVWDDADTFDHTRWLKESGMTEQAKLSFNPFGYGARQCLGIHLGRIEMRLAAAMFFRECAGARLGPSVTAESMRVVDSFIAGVPRDRRCTVTLQK